MARILIWMSLEPSHILPTIKLARDLQRLHHTVIYHTDRSLHDQLNRFGFCSYPFLERIVNDPGNGGIYAMMSSTADWHSILRDRFDGDVAAAYRAISADIQEAALATDADLVLIDSLMNYVYGITVDCSVRPRLRLGFIQSHLPLMLFGRNMAHTPRMLRRADRTIVLCPREFEVPEYEIATARYAEASIHLERSEIEFPWEWLDPEQKLVYCALGSQASLYSQAPQIFRSLLEVARRMPHCQFVISAGPHYRELNAVDSLSNCRIFSCVPQTNLLEKAAVMVLQGGLGSIKECIYFGVPMLVLPFIYDQPLNAFRVQYHGLGSSLATDSITAEGLHCALERLMDDQSVSARMRQMRAVFREREETNDAASICEELLL